MMSRIDLAPLSLRKLCKPMLSTANVEYMWSYSSLPYGAFRINHVRSVTAWAFRGVKYGNVVQYDREYLEKPTVSWLSRLEPAGFSKSEARLDLLSRAYEAEACRPRDAGSPSLICS